MKKIALLVVSVAILLAAHAEAANLDLVVMVDTSTSMFPSFDDLMKTLVQDLLTTKLHEGDSFHLLSFNSVPEEEISLPMGSQDAAEKVFGRILLLQPLGRYTDLVAALQFLYRYTRGLPETNQKSIILLTDGVHDPSPNSPNRGSPDQITMSIEEVARSIKKEGWDLHILKVPAEPVPGEEGLKSYLQTLSNALEIPVVPYNGNHRVQVTGEVTGFPSLIFPPALGKVGRRFSAPFRVKNFAKVPIIVRLVGVRSEGVELLENKVSLTVQPGREAALNVPIRLPPSLAKGDYSKSVTMVFEDDIRISPAEGTLVFFFTGGGGFSIPTFNFIYLLYFLLVAAPVFLLIRLFLFMRSKLHEAPLSGIRKTVSDQKESRPAHPYPSLAQIADTHSPSLDIFPSASPNRKLIPLMEVSFAGSRERPTVESLQKSLPEPALHPSGLPPMIEMRVSEQNSHVGFRNIHRIPQGGVRSVGGGFSSYQIFLVRVPYKIAEIRYADGKYTFIPIRANFFPALPGPISDCFGLEIPVSTPKGYFFTIRFREWISPLDEINALMRSIRREG